MTKTLPDLGDDALLDARVTESTTPAAIEIGDAWVLTLAKRLPCSATDAWLWLTDPGALARWSPIVPDRPLTSIGPATTRENPGDDPVDASVIVVGAPTDLVHRWGSTVVNWHLDDVAPGAAVLTLQHTFGERDGIAMTAAGWHLCLAVLAAGLAGDAVHRVVGTDALDHGWQKLADRYEEALRPVD